MTTRQKNKFFILLGRVLIVMGVVAAFLMGAHAKSALAQGPKEWKWPPALRIAAGGMEGSVYAPTVAWAQVMEKMTEMKVRAIPESSEAMTARWLKEGRVDIQLSASSSVAEYFMVGGGQYATRDGGPFQLGYVYIADMADRGYIVRGDSNIKTIYDLKPGVRVAVYTAVPATVAQVHALLAWVKLDPKDVVFVPFGTYGANIKSVAEGKADVAFASAMAPASVEAEAGPHGIRWLELPPGDREGYKRALAHRPTMVLGKIKGGVKSAIGVNSFIAPFGAFVRADTDPELIYHLVKWLDEKFDAYKDKHDACKRMHIDNLKQTLDNLPIPAHEGVVRYLKEKKMWTTENEVWNRYNIDLLTRYEKAYKEVIVKADEKNIKIDYKNKEWIGLWENYKKELGLPAFTMRIMAEKLKYK